MNKNLQLPRPSDYDAVYRRKVRATILDKIEAVVVADSEVTKLRCTGVLRTGDRERFRDLLDRSIRHDRASAVLLDLGCGAGRLGIWMADQLGVELVGLDFSPFAISLARRYISRENSRVATRFIVTTFDSISLPDSSLSAVFSLDALYLAENPKSALEELRRVMVPGAPLIFTFYSDSFEQHDWLNLLGRVGFDVLKLADITGVWREHMRQKHLLRWERRCAISEKLGSEIAMSELSVTASMLGLGGRPSYIASTFRYLVHAVSH